MPQMAPMNWLTLYLFFTVLFILCIIVNYYFYFHSLTLSENAPSTEKKMLLLTKNWKW
uniref:ATP synthase complex subunit 8 n=1 Tax=Orthotomicus laricis TaxID=102854 RepID=A0A2D0VPH6_9CUCU|nr:ATP synthase F0 subunit 8 [Orthotomicus laricis]AOY40192.1 ATP synthase F0 subunit 8 [Orthotomicus laricis]